AAETALVGDDYDVKAFVTTVQPATVRKDDRASVAAIAAATARPAEAATARTALVGTDAQVQDFLRNRRYPGSETDDRVLATQVVAAGGPGVQAAGRRALDGTADDIRAFLRTGQYTARETDDRVLATQAVSTGGPEVRASARASLAGPASVVRTFLESGLYRARQRDALTATHRAEVAGYVADAARAAALARQNAAEAAKAAAVARGAADDAARYAQQAKDSADLATTYAAQAAASAQDAKASADAAVQSANQAKQAEAAAHQAAQQAQQSANRAQASASDAAASASGARAAADAAARSAAEAHLSRDQAVQAAAEAFQRTVDLYLREIAEAAGGSRPDMTDPDGHPYSDDQAGHPEYHRPAGWERDAQKEYIHMLASEQTAAALAVCLNRPITCALFKHWAGASGTDYVLSADQMASFYGDEQWHGPLDAKLRTYADQAAAKCTGPVGTTCALKLDTNWLGGQFTEEPDHIFALHSFEYRVTGDLTARVTGDGTVQLTGGYRVDLKKAYNFDPEKPPINVRGVDYNVKALSQMPTVGIARDFTVQGSTNQYLDVPGHR
uniref:ALF repeat-containing protein n=1 Tax=Amycolatopsis kentuckyensis TaxID=218823 RepID=UPI001ABF6288